MIEDIITKELLIIIFTLTFYFIGKYFENYNIIIIILSMFFSSWIGSDKEWIRKII